MTDHTTPMAEAMFSEQEKLFCNDPTEFFEHSYTRQQSIDRDTLQHLQLRGLQYRFAQLRDRVPMLTRLADRQRIESLDRLEAVTPLLFGHAIYKSYPPKLLEEYRFSDINRWLNKLTTHDLTGIDVSACQCIDDWMQVMDKRSPLALCNSSGTTGTMSFMPHSKEEIERRVKAYTMDYLQHFGDDPDTAINADTHIIWPYFREPGGGNTLDLDLTIKYLLNGDDSRFHCAYPGKMSLDVLYLAARMRSAQAKGELDKLQIAPALLKRKQEFENLDKNMPAMMEQFLDDTVDKLRGKRIFLIGTWTLLHAMASKGLAMGHENVFAANSIIVTGGGAKGITPPDNWQQDVCRFIGVPRLKGLYGMTEILARNMACEYGHYHLAPWIIPYMLDPDTKEPLPREGVVTGRIAFYDLLVDTHWGGFITGDEVTLNWSEPCPCGQTSVYLQGAIERYSDKRGGDDKISCAATAGAHKEAVDFLSNLKH